MLTTQTPITITLETLGATFLKAGQHYPQRLFESVKLAIDQYDIRLGLAIYKLMFSRSVCRSQIILVRRTLTVFTMVKINASSRLHAQLKPRNYVKPTLRSDLNSRENSCAKCAIEFCDNFVLNCVLSTTSNLSAFHLTNQCIT